MMLDHYGQIADLLVGQSAACLAPKNYRSGGYRRCVGCEVAIAAEVLFALESGKSARQQR
jgi:hypothetical protein